MSKPSGNNKRDSIECRRVFRVASHSCRSTSLAFTLIELLVVVAVIGLLVGLLLPAMSAARRSAWRVVDLQNLRQIATASAAYQLDHQALPIRYNYSPSLKRVSTASWNIGGRTNEPPLYSSRENSAFIPHYERMLNPYLYDSVSNEDWDGLRIDGDEGVEGFGPEAEVIVDFEFFQSPADRPSLATAALEGYSFNSTGYLPRDPDLDFTGYELFGTSYLSNMWMADSPGYEWRDPMPGQWNIAGYQDRLDRIHRDIINTQSASRFVVAHEWGVSVTQSNARLNGSSAQANMFAGFYSNQANDNGLFQPEAEYVVAFLDGHAGSIPMTITDFVRVPFDKNADQSPGVYLSRPPTRSEYTFASLRYMRNGNELFER